MKIDSESKGMDEEKWTVGGGSSSISKDEKEMMNEVTLP